MEGKKDEEDDEDDEVDDDTLTIANRPWKPPVWMWG